MVYKEDRTIAIRDWSEACELEVGERNRCILRIFHTYPSIQNNDDDAKGHEALIWVFGRP